MSQTTPEPTPEDPLDAVIARLATLGIEEDDLIEQFILGDGSGGQKINKTHSCVQLRHPGLGIDIRCQDSRSRSKNRITARELLAEKIEARDREAQLSRQRRRAVQRAKHRKPSKAAKKRFREAKQHQSRKKQLRKGPGSQD